MLAARSTRPSRSSRARHETCGRTGAPRNGCCSSAPATALAPRSPRRSSTSMSDGTIAVASAGSNPKPLHPNAVRVMRSRGIDISANRTKHLDELAGQRFDLIITLCDRVREVCPEFPSQPELVHWSLPDPAAAGATNRASLPAFEQTATELETRIRFLLPLLERAQPTGR